MRSRRRRRLLGPAIVATLSLASCSSPASTLTPAGPGARTTQGLWWLFFAISLVVFLVIVGLLLFGLRRRGSLADHPPAVDEGTLTPIVVGGIVIPLVILIALFVVTLHAMGADAKPRASEMTVEVIGRQWWWELRYRTPSGGFETANELHVPVGRPVTLAVTSADVIHSVWIPSLHPKMDAIPGRVNRFVIEADHPGTWRGECAEYCGLQHANMNFVVVAESPTDYAAWAADQEQSAATPKPGTAAARGEAVFLASACADCHTIRGTSATGGLGPDLTHVAHRSTLAAVTIPNRRGYLMGWILDPQHVKPGNLMPAVPLTGTQARDVATYLESLR